ncbi:hypothetical protein AY609_11220 [Bacillus velezensis]|nr:hypothetical protein AY609_11220 [Bacillus velezensis]
MILLKRQAEIRKRHIFYDFLYLCESINSANISIKANTFLIQKKPPSMRKSLYKNKSATEKE